MKYWISLLFVVSLLFSAVGIASAATSVPKLVLNGKELTPVEPPALLDGRVMLPVRTVSENLGYTVLFDNKTKTVTVKNGNTEISMTVGSKTATVNGSATALDTPPILKSNSAMISLRFISANFGVDITWDNQTKSAFMYTTADSGGTGNGGTSNGGSSNGGTAGGDDSSPPDGGLIGIVDGNDGSGTDVPSVPNAAYGTFHQIRFENDTVILSYDGIVSPTTSVLTGPNRIVVDIPSSDYAADFTPALSLAGKSGSLTVSGHAALTQVRYSVYADNPKTLRFVLDLNQKWNYEVQNDAAAGELKIVLKKPESKVYTVVLDAGHGGTDPGGKSVIGKWEKEFNLAVILKLQAALAGDARLNLVLTRSSDTYPTLDDRVNLANSLNADLFLSVHANIASSTTAVGSETYYWRPESLAFANVIHQYAVPAGGLKDRGILKGNFKVIRETKMPAVLYEAGYMSNTSDSNQLFSDAFQSKLALGLAQGIKAYLNLN